jgi:hypothetical protein
MIPKKDPITKKKEILSNFKASFSKRLASDVQDEIIEDVYQNKPQTTKSDKRSAFHRRATTRVPSPNSNKLKPLNLDSRKSPEPKKSPRAATSSQRRPKFYGILGLDSIRDEENKLGSYKTVVEGGKMVL